MDDLDLPPPTLDTSFVDAFVKNEERIKHNAIMAQKQWNESRQEMMDRWHNELNETTPNIFYPRWPNWCSGYDETPFEFNTKEELEQCPHIQNFLKTGHRLELSKSKEEWLFSDYYRYSLMAIKDDAYWVIGSFKRSQMLNGWYPEWHK